MKGPMSENEQQADAQYFTQKIASNAPRRVRQLSVTVELGENDDVAEVVAKASELGNVKALNLYDDFRYDESIPY